MTMTELLGGVGQRLRNIRLERGLTLAQLAGSTGISVSTLSRLEGGLRKATLELLLPIAQAHGVALDALITPPPVADPRVKSHALKRSGVISIPLTREPSAIHAFKQVIAPTTQVQIAKTSVHEGFEWLYVLSGRLRLVLGPHDLTLVPGEVAEFDTRVPHWFGSADGKQVEYLTLFSKAGERMHVAVGGGT